MASLEETYDFAKGLTDRYVRDLDTTKVLKSKSGKRTATDILFLVIFDWRMVFFVTLFLSLTLAYLIKLAFDFIKAKGIYSEFGLLSINFFGHLAVLNAFIAVFTLSYYFFKKGHNGRRGPKGDIGPRGPQGKNSTCDICSVKVNTMKRDELEPEPMDQVDNTLFNNINKYKPKTWQNYKKASEIGNDSKCPSCVDTKFPNVNYVNGVIANFDEKITSFQYLYPKNNKTKLLGGKGAIVGDTDKKDNVVKVKCPANSGISQIDMGYDYSKKGIAAMRIFCRDIETGEDKTPTNNTIGKFEPHYKNTVAGCPNEIAFLGGLSANFSREQLNQLKFSQCNFKGT